MGELTRRAAETVNRGTSDHMLVILDQSLKSIEEMMVKELGTEGGVQRFFNPTLRDDPYKRMAEPSRRLWSIAAKFPMIQSVYLTRWEDHTVLSNNSALSWEQFEDRDFVEAYLNTGRGVNWSDLRQYREFASQSSVDVITIVKPYPVPAGNEGIMVVNVSAKSLAELARGMYNSAFSQAVLEDRKGNLVFASEPGLLAFGETVTTAQSEYSGLTIKSQLQGGAFFKFASRANIILLLSGLAAIIVAVFYITYISKRNIRPIRSLTERISGYSQFKSEQLLKNGSKDEFRYIEHALDTIIEHADDLMNQQAEHMHIRKREWIKDTLEGNYDTVGGTWADNSVRFGCNVSPKKMGVIVVEIDRYIDFCEKYTKRDQSLLKFLISNVVAEIAQHHQIGIFGEWLFPQRWCAFTQLNESHEIDDVAFFTKQVVTWVQENLDFGVTIGLGELVAGPENISASYEQALHALQFKMTLGNGRVISHWEVPEPNETAMQNIDINGLISAFKLGETHWEEEYDRYMQALQTEVMPRNVLIRRVDFLIYQFSRVFQELNTDYQDIWQKDAVPSINQLMSQFDTFEDLKEGLSAILRQTDQRLAELRMDRSYSTAMKEVRQYVNESFSNPDLSLNHLSQAFELNPKVVSHLFKEEFGEKFVDYLANVRVEKAKTLLSSTSLSVQEIALRVGYTHSFSFIRVFKKIVGMTPGDYRKHA